MTTYPELRLSERVTLQHGDKIRVSRGPYWKSADGRKISMAERGVMVFVDYQEDQHGNRIIRAAQRGVLCVLVIKRGGNRQVEGMRYRAYRIVKCRVKRNRKER